MVDNLDNMHSPKSANVVVEYLESPSHVHEKWIVSVRNEHTPEPRHNKGSPVLTTYQV